MSDDIIKDVTPELDENLHSEDKFYEEINIDDLGKKLESSAEGNTKPTFDSNTAVTVIGVTLKRSKKKAVTRDGNQYYNPIIVTIETKTDSGETSYDNYGGLRETEEGTLWCGETSQFGKLIKLIKEEDATIRTFNDVFKFLNTPGLRVKIKTSYVNFQNKEYVKNLITQFI